MVVADGSFGFMREKVGRERREDLKLVYFLFQFFDCHFKS